MVSSPSARRLDVEQLLNHLVRCRDDLRRGLIATLADDEIAELAREIHVSELDPSGRDFPEHAFVRVAEDTIAFVGRAEQAAVHGLEALQEAERRERELLRVHCLAIGVRELQHPTLIEGCADQGTDREAVLRANCTALLAVETDTTPLRDPASPKKSSTCDAATPAGWKDNPKVLNPASGVPSLAKRISPLPMLALAASSTSTSQLPGVTRVLFVNRTRIVWVPPAASITVTFATSCGALGASLVFRTPVKVTRLVALA